MPARRATTCAERAGASAGSPRAATTRTRARTIRATRRWGACTAANQAPCDDGSVCTTNDTLRRGGVRGRSAARLRRRQSLHGTIPAIRHRMFSARTLPAVQDGSACTVNGSQESSVQRLPSPQSSGAPPSHAPSAHVSFVVQNAAVVARRLIGRRARTPHSASARIVPCTGSCRRSSGAARRPLPVRARVARRAGIAVLARRLVVRVLAPRLRVARVVRAGVAVVALIGDVRASGLRITGIDRAGVRPSLQSREPRAAHDPSAHVSFVVQTLPSSHGPWLAACVHPVFGSHPSSVQHVAVVAVRGRTADALPLRARNRSPCRHCRPRRAGSCSCENIR